MAKRVRLQRDLRRERYGSVRENLEWQSVNSAEIQVMKVEK